MVIIISGYFRYAYRLGLRGAVDKAWEKLVYDRRRYRAGTVRRMPELEAPAPCPPLAPADGEPGSILYLIHCFYPERTGGTERFVLKLAQQARRRGGSARVLTMSFGTPEKMEPFGDNLLWKDYVYEGVPVTVFCYKKLPLGAFYKRIEEHDEQLEAFFSFICERERFDLVHAAYAQPYAAALRLCRERGLSYVVTATDFALGCHGVTMVTRDGRICSGSEGGKKCPHDCKSYAVKDTSGRHAAAERLLAGAKHVTAPSEYTASVFEAEFPQLSVRVVPHGIDPAFSPGKPRTQVRRFLYAGSFSALKGVDTLVRAFRAIPGDDITLDIYGSGSFVDLRRLKKLADGRVTFHGSVEPGRMPEVYGEADCAVIASLWPETYSFYLREALSCGCLVVAARLGAMPEAVTEGENGFLFDAGSIEKLQKALRLAMDFDMDNYVQASFPEPSFEADEYQRIYSD